jgi:hypothetical protein
MTARANAALAFASAIQRRYRLRTERSTLRLVFLRAPLVHRWQHTVVEGSHIDLVVKVDARGARGDADERAAPPLVPAPSPAERPAPSPSADRASVAPRPIDRDVQRPRPSAPPAEQIVRRPRAIAATIEPRSPASVTHARPGATVRDASPPPERVFRHAPPVTAPQTPPSSPHAARGEAETTHRPTTRITGATPSSDAADIRKIADQVIRTIDQRIAAQRERYGRA